MVDTPIDPSHDSWEELIAIAAVGTLPSADALRLKSHLAECPACYAHWEAYQRVSVALAHGIPLVPPPAHLENSLRQQIQKSPRSRFAFRPSVWQVAAIAAFFVVALLTVQLVTLNRQLAQTKSEQDILLETISSPEVHPLPAIALASQETVGYFIWAPGIRTGTLTVQGLPPHPPQRGYQLWLIRQDGTIDNGGMIQWEADGQGYRQVNAQVPWRDYHQFTITEEPATGSPTPTTPAVVKGDF